ncbi:hypothetical protein [Nocardioides psychrotolerans]|uniref:hypothetical protein n=1 Tax=Nocardioides psychrotolerans TaxID=1005945 RepID=UPI0031377C4E
MRTLPLLLASGALLTACTGSDEPLTTVTETRIIDLTVAERDDFLAKVEDLGYTCGPALDPQSPYDACTRPGAHPAATADTVTLTSTPDGATVTRVAYCGPERRVVAAMSEAFLAEVESPDLLADLPLPEVSGARVTRCRTTSGEGAVLGDEGLPTLLELDLPRLRQGLAQAGWTCLEDRDLDCREDGRTGTLVVGIGAGVQVAAADGPALARAVGLLGLSDAAVQAARRCTTGEPCDHLLVDGFDLFFSADAAFSRVRVAERVGF